jgi:hypothetical protein
MQHAGEGEGDMARCIVVVVHVILSASGWWVHHLCCAVVGASSWWVHHPLCAMVVGVVLCICPVPTIPPPSVPPAPSPHIVLLSCASLSLPPCEQLLKAVLGVLGTVVVAILFSSLAVSLSWFSIPVLVALSSFSSSL